VNAADLSEAIGVISSQLRLIFAANPEPVGFVALATLRHLSRHGPRSISELAALDRVTTQAISLRVAPLVEAGLAQRSADPADGRRTVVSVTDAGRRALAAAQGRAFSALETALETLDAADLTTLEAAVPVLHKLGPALAATSAETPSGQGKARHDA